VTATPPADKSPFPTGLGFLLGVAHRERRRDWEARLADLSLTAPQAALLRLVTSNPGRGIRRLARELATDPMNIARLADSLAERQLIETRADPAGARHRALYPTAADQRLAVVIMDRVAKDEEQVASQLGTDAYAALLHGWTRLVQTHRPLQEPGGPPRADPASGRSRQRTPSTMPQRVTGTTTKYPVLTGGFRT
jgi:DNA-binding MarR family transcriptional regulator